MYNTTDPHIESVPPSSSPMGRDPTEIDGDAEGGGNNNHYFTELSGHDVLAGRGSSIVLTEGNVRFRKLVQLNKEAYNGTGRHGVKRQVAQQIFDAIRRNGGRFLHQIDQATELRERRVPEGISKVWILMNDEKAMEKIKQQWQDYIEQYSTSTSRKTQLPNCRAFSCNGKKH